MFDEMTEIGVHVRTAELSEFESLCTDGTLIDTGECFEESTTPLIDVFKGDVTSEGVDD